MSSNQVDRKLEELDKAMKKLRAAMVAPVVRMSGFKRQHDDTARAIATATTTVEAARPLFETDPRRPRARRR